MWTEPADQKDSEAVTASDERTEEGVTVEETTGTTENKEESTSATSTDPRILREDLVLKKAMEAVIGNSAQHHTCLSLLSVTCGVEVSSCTCHRCEVLGRLGWTPQSNMI